MHVVRSNLHCLDVQLHIGGQVDVCHAEVCQRLHHTHHRRKDRVRMSRWCINQWPEQIHRWSSLGTSSRLPSELAIEATPFMSSLSATVSEPEVILVAKGHAYNYILPG